MRVCAPRAACLRIVALWLCYCSVVLLCVFADGVFEGIGGCDLAGCRDANPYPNSPPPLKKHHLPIWGKRVPSIQIDAADDLSGCTPGGLRMPPHHRPSQVPY